MCKRQALVAFSLAAAISSCSSSARNGQREVIGQGTVSSPVAMSARLLLVCNGTSSPCPKLRHYRTVQAAVDAAGRGDWILIWPGVYHEKNFGHHAGVWISTPGIHIRGLSRSRVIIDGSAGTAARPCPANKSMQDFTPRDGIVVWKANNVTIQNLTVCNYLSARDG